VCRLSPRVGFRVMCVSPVPTGWVSRSHGDTARGDGRHTDHRSNGDGRHTDHRSNERVRCGTCGQSDRGPDQSGPTTERAPPSPLLCSLVFEFPPLVFQPLSSLSLAFRRGFCLSVCFVCETTGHGTSTTFRGRRVGPACGPLRSRAWGRRVCCCRLL